MLQWTVVALVVLACAVNLAWALMPAALQRRWRARIGLAQRQGYAQNKGTGGCDSCSGCASAPAAEANPQPKVIRIAPRG